MSEKKNLSARQYLEQLEVIDIKINQHLERLEEMKVNATCIGAIDYSKDRVQTSLLGDKLSNDVSRYIDFDAQINAEIDRFVDAKEQIISEIQGLNVKNYIQVLFKRYVQYKSLKLTASEMGMSYQYVRNIHKKALASFDKTYKNLHYLT